MPYFCLWDHESLPISRASVEDRRKDRDKSGFRLRYVVSHDDPAHADGVVRMLDDIFGPRTKAHGVYQARYAELRAAYGDLLDATGPPPGRPGHLALRVGAGALAVALGALMWCCLMVAVPMFLLVSALRKQSGGYAMFEAAVLWSIFDYRRWIRALWHYARRA